MTETSLDDSSSSIAPDTVGLKIHDHCPIFLRKTYLMINSCDQDIARWSDDGKCIVIQDPEAFAAKIIPNFFKHSNLPSFIRQLNFYGFRKLRRENLKEVLSENYNFRQLYFRHENFIRDRPELLMKIFRIRKIESSENQQIKALENEVHCLKKYIFLALEEINELKSRMNCLVVGAETKIEVRDLRQSKYIILKEKQDAPVFKYSPVSIQDQHMKHLCSREVSSDTDATLSGNKNIYESSSEDSCHSIFRRRSKSKVGANDKLLKATLDLLNTSLWPHPTKNIDGIPERVASSENKVPDSSSSCTSIIPLRENVIHGGEDGSVSAKQENKSRKRSRDGISQLLTQGPENYQFPENESVEYFKEKLEIIDPELSAKYSGSIAMLPEGMRHRFAGNFF